MLVATAADEKITYEGCSAMIAGSLSKRPDRRRNESGHSRIGGMEAIVDFGQNQTISLLSRR